MTPDRASAACELLEFYSAAGVDALVCESSTDRLGTTQAEVTTPAAISAPEWQPIAAVQSLPMEMAPMGYTRDPPAFLAWLMMNPTAA